MADLLPITRAETIKELQRELAMRRSVYPRQVDAKKLAQATADRRIAMFEDLVEALQAEEDRARSLKAEGARDLVERLRPRITARARMQVDEEVGAQREAGDAEIAEALRVVLAVYDAVPDAIKELDRLRAELAKGEGRPMEADRAAVIRPDPGGNDRRA